MDGNGRWAEERGLSRSQGHIAGAETVRRVTAYARRNNIPFLTLYAFSTENWSRPQEEVEALMHLLGDFIDSELPTLVEKQIRLRVLGDMEALSPLLRQKLRDAIEVTKANEALTLALAINYGGRDEIVRAARCAMGELLTEGRPLDELDEEFFAAHLDTTGMPDPDLLIRTAGELRLSNFLIWQCAYAEFVFSPRRWPEFSDQDFDQALTEYAGRTRKFGGNSTKPLETE